MNPPNSQQARTHPPPGTLAATKPVVVNMPAPIMFATTMLVAVTGPICLVTLPALPSTAPTEAIRSLRNCPE